MVNWRRWALPSQLLSEATRAPFQTILAREPTVSRRWPYAPSIAADTVDVGDAGFTARFIGSLHYRDAETPGVGYRIDLDALVPAECRPTATAGSLRPTGLRIVRRWRSPWLTLTIEPDPPALR